MASDIPNIIRPARPAQADSWSGQRLSQIEQVRRLLLGAVDAGLAGVIFLVPLILGGRIAWGQLALVVLALWVAVCWCLRQCLARQATWVRSPLTILLVAALALAGLQLAALPSSLLALSSPHLYETLPLWAPDSDFSATLGLWTTPSLTPLATREAFVSLLAFALLSLTTVQRVRRLEDVERLLRWIAVSTLVLAAFALLQFLTGNGKYFWFFEYPFSDPTGVIKGSFTNPNHFAQFIALGMGPLIWWVIGRSPGNIRARTPQRRSLGRMAKPFDAKQGLRAVGMGCCAFVGLMSLSRGGALVIFLAALVCTFILYRGSLVGRKTLLVLVGVGLFVGAGLLVYGFDPLMKELDTFGSIDTLDQNEVRRKLWQAEFAAIADYPLLGTGLASHREVIPTYLHQPETWRRIEYTHAENGYIQVALEAGLSGLLLVLVAIGLCAYWCLSSLRRAADKRMYLCLAAIAAGLVATCIHSTWDFIWYVPGCMVVPVILAACVCRLHQITREETNGPTPLVKVSCVGWIAATACLALVGYFMVQNCLVAVGAEPSWHRFLLLNEKPPAVEDDQRCDTLLAMTQELSVVVRRQPDHARAHARLAAIHYELFDSHHADADALSIAELRHAVLASYSLDPEIHENVFTSAEDAKRWMSVALPQRHEHAVAALQHASRALALCPLQGEAYLPLIAFSFLDGPKRELPQRAALLEQALKVRPFDGDVLFTAGVVAVDKIRALKEEDESLQRARSIGEIDDFHFAKAREKLKTKVENSKTELQQSERRAVGYWQASFRSDSVCQKRLIKHLAGQISVGEFLRTFEPDLEGLRLIARHYRELDQPEELNFVTMYLANAAQNRARRLHGKQAANYWREAARAYQDINQPEESLRCLFASVRANSTHYGTRLVLGKRLLALKEFDQAKTHLTWCLRRKPQDKNLRKLLEAAVDGRLRLSSRPESGRTG